MHKTPRTLWFILCAIVVHRTPSLLLPFWTKDEGYWWAVGNGVARGAQLYAGATDHKPPLFLGTYAWMIEQFGDLAMPALHLWVILGNVFIAYALYRISRTTLGDQIAVYVAAAFAFLQANFITQEHLAANSENLMMPWLVAALWLYSLALTRQRYIRLLGAGLCLGIAFLMRQTAGLLGPVLVAHLALHLWRTRGTWWHWFCGSLVLTLATCVPIVVTAWHFWHAGTAADAFFWNITLSSLYVGEPFQLGAVIWDFVWHTATIVPCAWIVWSLAAQASWHAFKRSHRTENSIRLWMGFLGAMLIATAAGWRFSHHYYIQLYPPLALLAGAMLKLRQDQNRPLLPWSMRSVVISLCIPLCIFSAEASYRIYRDAQGLPRASIRQTGAWLQVQSASTDQLFLWGYYPELYYYSGLRNASRYVETHFLTGQLRDANDTGLVNATAQLWDWLMADLQRNQPRWIVDTSAIPVSRRYLHGMERHPRILDYVHTHYEERRRFGPVVVWERIAP